MRRRTLLAKIVALAPALPLIAIMTVAFAQAQTETVLHSLKSKEGVSPLLGLIFDSSGNLYGVAPEGGASNAGSVFELTKSGSTWTEKTLHSFNGAAGGGTPLGTLIFDSSGHLFGTTKLGGSHNVGVAYELTKSSSGTWTETVLHNFGVSKDGQYPTGKLVLDSLGNLYGTTEGGGAHGNGQENVGGTAYKLSKSGSTWSETVIHSFGGGTDGISPRCNLVFDTSGNLYGTALLGGSHSSGIVFELTPQSGGGWKEKIIYNFAGGASDGSQPSAGLVFDTAGNLYGTTIGSPNGGGTVYKLAPSGGTWTESVLFNFTHAFYDPSFPYSNLILDSSGNLYGATLQGIGSCCTGFNGTVFELELISGTWNEISLYSFDGTHGAEPGGGSLIFDSAGNLYGATQAGGANKVGVVFEITP
jgi:uncharacterized repeat protein (TIGR03803 family)